MLEQPSLEPVSETEYRQELTFWLNGNKVTIQDPEPDALLSSYLHDVGLTGTKVGCGQGGCGACTVLVSAHDPQTGTQSHRGINACLRPLCTLDGATVTTTEGLGDVRTGLDPAQFAIAKCNGTQCGFCTPGFVMNAHSVLRNHPNATEQQIEDNFGGNICRCTGYRPILHAVRTLASDYKADRDCTMKCQIDPSYSTRPRNARCTSAGGQDSGCVL
jgi:xanthine dehydrogenase/oxidase